MALLIGVWIDQKKAVLAVAGGGVTTVHSHVEAHPHWSGAQDGGGEQKYDARHADQMNRFFDEVIAHLGAAQSLFLFGPGESKVGLRNRLAMGTRATLAAALLMCVSAVACAPMRVSSHVDRGRDFSRYRTYDWGPADALPASDPRFERNSFFQDHIRGAIERNMAGRGFERAAPGATPDVRVHFHVAVDRRLDVNQLDSRAGYCIGGDCQAGLAAYEEGTLVIDVIDVPTNRLVWRGWARDSVEGVLENRDQLARKIEDAVRQMLQRLPAAR